MGRHELPDPVVAEYGPTPPPVYELYLHIENHCRYSGQGAKFERKRVRAGVYVRQDYACTECECDLMRVGIEKQEAQ